jgi:hypothetical protein
MVLPLQSCAGRGADRVPSLVDRRVWRGTGADAAQSEWEIRRTVRGQVSFPRGWGRIFAGGGTSTFRRSRLLPVGEA